MKGKRSPFSENFQWIVFTVTYILSCLFVFTLFFYFTPETAPLFKILFTLGFVILAIIAWAYLFVIFSIPRKMPASFDRVKNKIADRELKDVEGFSAELNRFIVEFFNYTFFDVQFSAIKTIKSELIVSDAELNKLNDWGKLEKDLIKLKPLIVRHGKFRIKENNYYRYTVPVYFGEIYLGYISVFTAGKLGPLSQRFLLDLEENYIDDLLMLFVSENISSF